MKLIKWTCVVVFLAYSYFGIAQNLSSPYTSIGIGEILTPSTANQSGMADVGIGLPSALSVNTLNPAHLYLNGYTVFELGVQADARTISANNGETSASSAGYKYLTMSFPIKPYKWTASIGLNPYSSFKYSLTSQGAVEGAPDDTFEQEIIGNGGLTELRFSNGVKINDDFAVGVRISYLFGFTEHMDNFFLTDQGGLINSLVSKTSYSGANIGTGFSYNKKLSEEKILFIGLTYDLSTNLNGETQGTISSQILADEETELVTGTGSDVFKLPSKFGFGVGWLKENKIALGLDVTWTNWEDRAGFGNSSRTYNDVFTAGLGAEYTPRYNDVDNYLARIRYRLGLKFEQLPSGLGTYSKNINDVGINFGWSLPVRGASSINMAFKYGQRGTTQDSQVRESYFKFIFGATLNDRWFVRRKYN